MEESLEKSSPSNCASRSVITSRGTPNRDIQPEVKAIATEAAVVSMRGIASGHQVARSIQVNRYRKGKGLDLLGRVAVGNAPTMSM